MLDPETRTLFLETTHKFVNEVLIPAEAAVSETDQIPADIVKQMQDLGLFGLSIPEEFGGLGLSMSDEVEVAMILGQASPAFRSLAGTNIGIGSQAIIFGGSDAQRTKYLPDMASGALIGSFALTEPDVGSDAASVKTSARKTEGGYILNGTKRFITNAPEAGLFTVMARTGEPGAKGVSCFLVEAGSTGLSVGPRDKKMGQRGAHTADVILQDCFVPDDALLGGQEGTGFTAAMRTLDKGRLHISAICAGAARRLLDEALRYASERQQFGKPIAEFQLVQAMLAESQTELYAAECMIRDAARRRDAGENAGTLASCCKLYASEMVGRVADRAVQIFGGAGYMAEYPIERFYRDVRLFRLYEGTSEIQKIIIAKSMLRNLDS